MTIDESDTASVLGRRAGTAAVAVALLGVAWAADSARPAAAQEAPIPVLVHDRAPYYVIEDGTVSGIVAEPTAQAFADAGIAFAWRELASNRHLRVIRQNAEPVCATGWFKTPERTAFARYSVPIYADRPAAVLVRADNDRVRRYRTLSSIMADDSLLMGAKLGYSYGAAVDAMIDEFATRRVMTTQDNVGMMRMLLGKRFDYMIASFEEADGLIAAGGAAPDAVAALSLDDMPAGNTRYIVCSKRVPQTTMNALNAAIERIRTRTD
jgi:polar amino acid transport system substrate-binding protein